MATTSYEDSGETRLTRESRLESSSCLRTFRTSDSHLLYRRTNCTVRYRALQSASLPLLTIC